MKFPKIPEIAKPEHVLCLIKPDGVYRGLVGKITGRFEQVGLKLVYCRMQMPELAKVKAHYENGPAWVKKLGEKTLDTYKEFGIDAKKSLGTNNPEKIGEEVVKKLIEYIMSGPIIVMVWEGVGAINVARKIRGTTTPITADVGSIIGDYSHDSQLSAPFKGRSMNNLVHLSGEKDEAKREIKIWLGNKPEFEDYERMDEAFF